MKHKLIVTEPKYIVNTKDTQDKLWHWKPDRLIALTCKYHT